MAEKLSFEGAIKVQYIKMGQLMVYKILYFDCIKLVIHDTSTDEIMGYTMYGSSKQVLNKFNLELRRRAKKHGLQDTFKDFIV